ncbi:hypothetical protein EQV77_10930 [Halobacillus fulvus]|nr:hypothetical protein EQV77_10930 [Halobacillus fulvus]
MVITVKPCFHWIGYHIMTSLLQEGMEVVGIDRLDQKRKDHLYMYVGRNSNFQYFFNEKDKENHIHQEEEEIEIRCSTERLIGRNKKQDTTHDWKLPIVYGEWMDIQRMDIESEEELLDWVLQTEAVYIGDVTTPFLDLLLDREDSADVKREDQQAEVASHVREVWQTHLRMYPFL